MRSRGVGAMGSVGRGGWDVGVVPVLTVWSDVRSTLELMDGVAVRLDELLGTAFAIKFEK
jgi:hypothetical protein